MELSASHQPLVEEVKSLREILNVMLSEFELKLVTTNSGMLFFHGGSSGASTSVVYPVDSLSSVYTHDVRSTQSQACPTTIVNHNLDKIHKVVSQVISDVSRRRKNIIVTGLF